MLITLLAVITSVLGLSLLALIYALLADLTGGPIVLAVIKILTLLVRISISVIALVIFDELEISITEIIDSLNVAMRSTRNIVK